MTTFRIISNFVLADAVAAALTVWLAAPGCAMEKYGVYSAGEPGNPKKPTQIVRIVMREGDGGMFYAPEHLDLRKGEQIKFELRNEGATDHEFVLATTAENLKHAEIMKKNPDMEHDDPNMIRLAPGKSGAVLWKFTKTGNFEYSCLIPGHREAGMLGTIVVK